MPTLTQNSSITLLGGAHGKILKITQVGTTTQGGLGHTVHPNLTGSTGKSVTPEQLPFRFTLGAKNSYTLKAGSDDLTYSLT